MKIRGTSCRVWSRLGAMRGLSCMACGVFLGCGPSVAMTPPTDFVVVEDEGGVPYEVRATSAHGVVLAARTVSNQPQGNLRFWEDAVKNRLRTTGGYALLEESEIRAASGQSGRFLKFGRDERSQTYVYWLALFVTADDVVVVEAGGRQDRFDAAEESVVSALRSVRFE